MSPNDTVASQLVLGKFDGNYTNETQWLNMTVGEEGMQASVTGAWEGNSTLFPNDNSTWNATFLTGYPYIGMPARVFNQLADQLET